MIAIYNTKLFYNKIFFISIFLLIIILFNLFIFSNVYLTSKLSISFLEKTHTFPSDLSFIIKSLSIIVLSITWIFALHLIHRKFIIPLKTNEITSKDIATSSNSLLIGKNPETNEWIAIPEKGLYQNILVTGTIGTGKTSSAMYPFTRQLINMNMGMLILDVKGNFHSKVKEIASKLNRKVIVIELGR